MTVWQVQPLAKRYLRGAPAVRRVDGPSLGAVQPKTLARGRRSIGYALAWLLGGYALVTGLVSWALANGHAEHEPVRALAPLGLVIAIPVAIAALGATVFAGRRYMVVSIATLGLAVGVTVASAGALITTSF